MHGELATFIESVKQDRDRIQGFDEAKTVQSIVQRILHLLDWNIFDEVIPEYSLAGGKVDLALQRNGSNRVFIEAKRVGANLEMHQVQLLRYAFSEGVRLAVLTSGVSWWLYLPLADGSWEQRRFFALDLLEQDSEFVAENLDRFLSRKRVESGDAENSAEEYRQSRQRRLILRKTLPLAWNKLVTQPDELLLDLLIETAETLSGYRAEQEMVATFLSRNRDGLLVPEPSDVRDLPSIRQAHQVSTNFHEDRPLRASDLTGTKPTGFAIGDEEYEISWWIEMLIAVCDRLYDEDAAQFEEAALSLVGRKRPYFSRNPDELRIPSEFRNTGIFFEANLSSSSIYMRSRSLLALFDYDPDSLRIYLDQSNNNS